MGYSGCFRIAGSAFGSGNSVGGIGVSQVSGRCIYYTTSNPGWGQRVNQGLELGLKKQVVKKDNHKTEIFIINTFNSHHSSIIIIINNSKFFFSSKKREKKKQPQLKVFCLKKFEFYFYFFVLIFEGLGVCVGVVEF